jgi:hypothetical protein
MTSPIRAGGRGSSPGRTRPTSDSLRIRRSSPTGSSRASRHSQLIRRTGYTAENKPVRVMVSIVPGDTLILQYTIPT